MKLKLSALSILGCCTLFLVPTFLFSQGSLTPPGAPAPTMKTLDEIEARTPISSLPYAISAPGSYYLTKNLTATGSGAGITIAADNVTIDLNGFALTGGGSGTVAGITVPAAHTCLCVRNGTVSGWTDGGISADNASGANANGSLYEKLRVSNNSSSVATVGALQTGAGSTVKDCTLFHNTCRYGIEAGAANTVVNCSVISNGVLTGAISIGPSSTLIGSSATNDSPGSGTGILASDHCSVLQCTVYSYNSGIIVNTSCQLSQCVANGNAYGIYANFDGAILSDCVANSNVQGGITLKNANTITRCTANSDGGYSFQLGNGSTITDCTANKSQNGILVNSGNTVRGCTVRTCSGLGLSVNFDNQVTGNTFDANGTSGNSSSGGLFITSGGNKIDSNSFTGNFNAGLFTTNNSAFGNIVIRNTFTGTAYILVSPDNTVGPFVDMASAGGGAITNTNPWANIYY